jgi:glycosyltransferase involved in cell wall biosynthesis
MSRSPDTMQILLLTPQLPYPPHQGTSLRNFNIIRGLALQSNYELSLLTFRAPEQDEDVARAKLAEFCSEVRVVPVPQRTHGQRLRRLLTDRRPDMAHRLQSGAFDIALREMLAAHPYDIVQIEGIELARVIPLVREARPAARIVFDDHNAEAELQHRAFLTDVRQPRRWPLALYSFIQARRLRRYEAWTCREADAVTVVSKADRRHLQGLVPGLEPTVVPNCIDVQAYQTAAGADVPQYDVLFSGKMDYRPNVDAVQWFAREVWPLIRAGQPAATFGVVGQKPHARLEPLREVEGITLTGFVPQIQPYLAGATVFVMPFRMGSGTRLKLIEAMAAQKAVVSTRIGAEGYPVVEGRHLLLADEPADFARAVLSLLRDEEKRSQMGAEALQLATQYDWRQVIGLFSEVYASIGRFMPL